MGQHLPFIFLAERVIEKGSEQINALGLIFRGEPRAFFTLGLLDLAIQSFKPLNSSLQGGMSREEVQPAGRRINFECRVGLLRFQDDRLLVPKVLQGMDHGCRVNQAGSKLVRFELSMTRKCFND
jgi:hypothetical protein